MGSEGGAPCTAAEGIRIVASTGKSTAVITYARAVVRWRWAIVALTLVGTIALGYGMGFLWINNDYRVYFQETNKRLIAFDELEKSFTKNDFVLFALRPENGDVFTRENLEAIQRLTEESWQVPFSIRVDSITNFQHTRAEEDDLIVEDLVFDAATLSDAEIESIREIALAEPMLRNRIIAEDSEVAGIAVTLQLPEKSNDEETVVVEAVREMARALEHDYPGIKIYMTGTVLLNNAFTEAAMHDMTTLFPIMYIAIIITMFLLLRSVIATLATVIVIILSSVDALGAAGWADFYITSPTATTPIVIMTLAVADCVHILATMLHEMRLGRTKHDAIVESLRINAQPVFLTSITTAIGFLSMNFSDSPPLWDLGNITAMGVLAAYVNSVFFLPAFMAIAPLRVRKRAAEKKYPLAGVAEFVIRRRTPLLVAFAMITVLLASFIPKNILNDQFVNYFDERITFRTDTDFITEELTGLYQIGFGIGAGEAEGISDPEYLARLEDFCEWYRQQPGVIHVSTITDVFERLNMNMHGDDPAYYRLPDNRELAAQYLLLYEMSLPYGLDLNNTVNVDKSITRVMVTVDNVTSEEIRALTAAGEAWLKENGLPAMQALGVGPPVLFADIAWSNIVGMLSGTTIALVLISFIILFALRSVRIGLMSLLPNLAPATMGFGIWGLTVGQVGMSLSVVTAMTLGIVVDDTVHFLSKYLRARRELNLDIYEAVRYAFNTVGMALITTSIILVTGFGVLSTSAFEMNAGMGLLTVIVIICALIADLLLLPPLLMAIDGRDYTPAEHDTAA